MSDGKYQKFASLAALSASSMTLRNVVLASPAGNGDVLKVKGVLKTVSGSPVLFLEYACTEGRVRQENIAPGQVEEKILLLTERFKRGEINDAGGSASLMVSKKGKVNLSVRGSIGSGEPSEISEKKEKNYILDGSEDFLVHLGISDKSGRVHDKKTGEIPSDKPLFGACGRYDEASAEGRCASCGGSVLRQKLSQLCGMLLSYEGASPNSYY